MPQIRRSRRSRTSLTAPVRLLTLSCLSAGITAASLAFAAPAHAGDPGNPLDADFKYVGRSVRLNNPNRVLLQTAGCYVVTRFTGTRIQANFASETRNGSTSRVRVRVYGTDGGFVKQSVGSITGSGSVTVSGLANGTYQAEIYREDDALSGGLSFRGVTLDSGRSISAPSGWAKSRRIEFYGDSVTAGVEAASGGNNRGSSVEDSGFFSYANALARKFNARPYNNGQGGLAVLNGRSLYGNATKFPSVGADYSQRNSGNNGGVGLQSTYNRVVVDEQDLRPYSFGFKPQLVVFACGINDVNAGVLPNSGLRNQWKDRYKAIARDVHERGKDANGRGPVLLFHVPALGFNSQQPLDAVEEVANELRGEGLPAYFRGRYSQNLYDVTANGAHPNRDDSNQIADELKAFIDANTSNGSGGILDALNQRGWNGGGGTTPDPEPEPEPEARADIVRNAWRATNLAGCVAYDGFGIGSFDAYRFDGESQLYDHFRFRNVDFGAGRNDIAFRYATADGQQLQVNVFWQDTPANNYRWNYVGTIYGNSTGGWNTFRWTGVRLSGNRVLTGRKTVVFQCVGGSANVKQIRFKQN